MSTPAVRFVIWLTVLFCLTLTLAVAKSQTMLHNTTVIGEIETQTAVTSPSDCGLMCSNATCVAAVFSFQTMSCTLFSVVSQIIENTNDDVTIVVKGGTLWSGVPDAFASWMPEIEGGVMYSGDAAISAYSGDVIWKSSVVANENTYPLLMSDAVILCGSAYAEGTSCVSLNRSTGTTVWNVSLGSVGPVLFANSGGNVVVETSYGTLDTMNLMWINHSSGIIHWNASVSIGWYLGSTETIILMNTFYESSDVPCSVYGVDVLTGAVTWRTPLPMENATVTDGTPYTVLGHHGTAIINFRGSPTVYKLNVSTGVILWNRTIPEGTCTVSTGVISTSDAVVVMVTTTGVVGMSQHDGTPLWSFEDPTACFGGTIAASGEVLYLSRGGEFPQCASVLTINATSGVLVSYNTFSACPLQVIASPGALYAAFPSYIVAFDTSNFSLVYNYSSPSFVAQTIEVFSLTQYLLLALLSGNATIVALWR